MKYLILIPDGMADRPLDMFGGMTPMEKANKPAMDALAARSLCGTVSNVPDGMVPESDTANLAILSYDPREFSKGRSPLEAMSLGLSMDPDDTAIRCNIVTLSGDSSDKYSERTMIDHSADEISTEEADELVKALNEALPMEGRVLHTGVSYRHCLIWKNANDKYPFMRPHDILGQVIGEHLPSADNGGEEFLRFMEEGAKILDHHPVNEARRARGLKPANSPWLWSPGKKPALPSFSEKWGISAAIVSAVDLIKGIGVCAGCDVIDVEGATGNFNTNYSGKAQAAIDAFEKNDLVYIHVEAPDECGHRGEPDVKVASIEKIDAEILTPVWEYLKGCGEDYKIMVLPDHPTPIETRTHAMEPVPFFIYDSREDRSGVDVFTEKTCSGCDTYISDGSTLMDLVIEK
ncbi:MAG: cofactor-independent phosphoglycerate mutase [Ruminococcaceae bacterium]|nr:cofactor-independent phosphoglycerate mutase [Oscillospiraceae bacterium]